MKSFLSWHFLMTHLPRKIIKERRIDFLFHKGGPKIITARGNNFKLGREANVT